MATKQTKINYKESSQILEEIKKAKKILLNCHASPDPDSISSAMSLKFILEKMGKQVTVFCPDNISDEFYFISGAKTIKTVSFSEVNYSDFDLFILADSSEWKRIQLTEKPENIKTVSIDHHQDNKLNTDVRLLDIKASSTAEILYLLFQDWKVSISGAVATLLLTGIAGDTGFLQFTSTTPRTCRVVATLRELGGNYDYIVLQMQRSFEPDTVKFWGELIVRLEVDKKHKFVWSAVPYDVYKNYNVKASPTSLATDRFLRVIDGMNFAVGMVEKVKGKILALSFRSRISGFNVARIASELGGGGHIDAAGGAVIDLPFEEAVEKVLKTARKFAKENAS